ncbi:MAG: hypothetical protein WC083_05550 [Candidatus Methanomethylophilaceae archaeon]
MSTVENNDVAVETPAPKKTVKKAAAKKTTEAPKKAAKKAAKKTAKTPAKKAPVKKSAPAAEKTSTKKIEGIRKPQVRILEALFKAGHPLSRKQIAEKATVDTAWCTEWIGSNDQAKREANDRKHFPSLVSLGFVRFSIPGDSGEVFYEITAAGRKAIK